MKKCPFCAEEIQDAAIKCRWCGEMLPNSPVGISLAGGEAENDSDEDALDPHIKLSPVGIDGKINEDECLPTPDLTAYPVNAGSDILANEAEKESLIQRAFLALTETVKPDDGKIRTALDDYRKAHPKWSKDRLAEKWADRACWLYASEGAVSALPGAIPGIGTAVQAAIEAGMISADLAYMIRCMAGMVAGIAMVYDRDLRSYFNQEFVKVLGLWCGVLYPVGEATVRIASKVAVAQFKKVPGKVFQKINQRVGVTIVTKYGTKRGGIAIGRVIPFGVGAVVGGGFNLATMKGFKAAALKYFKNDQELVMSD